MENFEIKNKSEMLKKLRSYASTPDDDNIRIKEKIKQVLLNCPELLYALHNKELEGEIFDKNGKLTPDGEWDRYFGVNSNIKPTIAVPETQTEVANYLCYKVEISEIPSFNTVEKYCRTTFVIYCHKDDCWDKETGIPRSDLIGSIIREVFNWSNYFGPQCKIVLDQESLTDKTYVTRTIVFENKMPNSILKTTKGKTEVINYRVKL